MAGTRKLEIVIAGDAKSATNAFKETDSGLSKLGDGIKNFAKIAAVGLVAAGAGVAVFAKSAIGAASDLGESLSKVNVVFGENAKDIEKWASTAATSMGMTKQAALEAAGTFGNFLIAMGNAPDAAKDMSKEMIQLAADIASFNNVDSKEVLENLRSGLAGEAEPLRKFGVNLSAATIEAMGASVGIKKLQKDMTGAEKSTLAYMVIMKDTALAQGDFARTSDGLANKTRILKARFGDMQAQMGTALLPVALALADVFMVRLLPALQMVWTWVGKAAAQFKEAFNSINKTGEWEAHGNIEKLGVIAAKVFGWLQENGPKILAAISTAVKELAGWVKSELIPALGVMWGAFERELWPTIKEKIIPALVEMWVFFKEKILPVLGDIVIFVMEKLVPAWASLVNFVLTEFIPKIAELTVRFWQFVIDVKEVVLGITNAFLDVGEKILAPFKWAFEQIEMAWNASGVGKIVDKLAGIGGVIGGALFGNGPNTGGDPGPQGAFQIPKGVKVKGYASGGMVRARPGGTIVRLGEGGQDEFVIPRNKMGGTQAITLNIDGRSFMTWLVDYSRDAGGIPITTRSPS